MIILYAHDKVTCNCAPGSRMHQKKKNSGAGELATGIVSTSKENLSS